MNKKIRFITEIAIFAAVGVVLDLIVGLLPKITWLNGGSISIAMVPILLMGYRHGLKGGLLTGLIIGSVQLIYSAYLLNFIQVMLDYVLAYTVVGLAAILWYNIQTHNKLIQTILIICGTLLGIFIRLVLATISGYYFWGTELIPSFTYNLTYLLPSAILCIIIMIILINALPKNLLKQEYIKE